MHASCVSLRSRALLLFMYMYITYRAQTADLKILIADCSLHTELLQTLSDSSLIISDLARRLLELNSTEKYATSVITSDSCV